MNRQIKQETANLRKQPNVHGSAQELPYWSDYLLKLGSQVKKAANTTIWSGEPVQHVVAGGGQQPRARHPGGDRRMSVEQRRQQLADISSRAPSRADDLAQTAYLKKELPFLSDYLTKLGQQLKNTVKTNSEQQALPDAKISGGENKAAARARYGIRRPIGDRRTGPRQRRAVQSDVATPQKRSWLKFLTRCWDRKAIRSQRADDPVEKSLYAKLSLGMWGYYFIAKLGMLCMGYIAFHALENLVFAAFLLLPATSRLLHSAKNIMAVVMAVALFYHDSWLPPIGRLLSQATLLSSFSFSYIIELLGRFISLPVIAALFVSWFVYWFVSRRIRLGALIVVSMMVAGIVQSLPESHEADKVMPDMDKVVQDFFVKESQRSVLFVTPQAEAVPFDVIFLHVCSLSWDDVRAVGLEDHPLWKRFDILFKKFNSAASYSGPAAIHLLRGKCGQPQHAGMYMPVEEKCYLMNSLLRSGFVTNVALNHDGKFDDFLGQVQSHGRLTTPPLELGGVDIAQYAFDNSPVYDDLSVLNRWLEMRLTSTSPRVALYYNTVSLHDGNHLQGTNASPNTLDTYKSRLSKFLDEIEGFMQQMDASGRRAVVVMVPEHGGAVRGDKRQIAGLREIPTPSISLVPVGIRLVGGKVHRQGEALLIDQSTSYLAISHIVERMLEQSPFNGNSFVPADYVADLPTTPFVSQNETTTVAEYSDRYYLSRGVTKWEAYTEFNQVQH